MNFRKLITYLTMGTAAAMPFAVAQNPTILQGNYITNVFGNSNFVLNPNAQTNIANVTVSSATVTRSTTTPLVATSEFNITTSTSTGYADWSTRTFDAGMKGQNCEARFSYRGFSVGSTTAQILQGANVVAQLTLTASTDPRIASINFPCGDLSSATTFRLQQATASLTGTNEIGGIYIGLATNMANVAQAEFVGSLTWATGTDSNQLTGTSYAAFGAFTAAPTVVGSITSPSNAPAFTIPSFKPGNYRVVLTGQCMSFSSTTTDTSASYRLTDGSTQFGTAFVVRNLNPTTGANIGSANPCGSFDFQYTGATTSKTFQVEGAVAVSGTTMRLERSSLTGFQITVYRFPSSSELVVTPERQNVFGGVKGYASTFSNLVTSTTWTNITAGATLTRIPQGKASTAASNDYAITIDNLPVGSYFVAFTGDIGVQSQAGSTLDTTECNVSLTDGTTRSGVSTVYGVSTSAAGTIENRVSAVSGIFNYTSIGSRTWTLQMRRALGGGKCYANANTVDRQFQITVIPLDQPTNSALYVEGPVKASATGAAIPAGYVGEMKYVRATSITLGAAGAWKTMTSQSLPTGVWLCSTAGTMQCTAKNCEDNGLVLSGVTNANSPESEDGMKIGTNGLLGWTFQAVGSMPVVIRSDGSNLIWFNGSTTTGTTVYAVAKTQYPSGTPSMIAASIMCTRLN